MNDRQIDSTRFLLQKCVVCNSFGTLKYGKVICHGCNGKGYIVIDGQTGFPVDEKIEREKENED